MKCIVAIAAAAAVAFAASPALAKSKSKKHRIHHGYYAQPYAYAPYPGVAWRSRYAADPSFGNRAGINYARRTGRCVEDLGYGRYEYCGW